MALKLSFLGKKTDDVRDYQYKDLVLDIKPNFTANRELLKDEERDDLSSIYDINVISNSLKNFLTTIPGQKLLNPFFGIDLRRYLFEPVSNRVGSIIGYDIRSQIDIFEPRINVENVIVNALPEENTYVVEIIYTTRLRSGRQDPIRLEGIINSDGYFILNTSTSGYQNQPFYK